jgi:small conductance mechanosensitive channel
VDWVTENRDLLIDLGWAALILLGTWILVRIMRRAVDRFLAHRAVGSLDAGAKTRFEMIERLAAAALFFLGAGLALFVINVEILRKISVAMFASAGVVAIAIGFAAQTTASNLVSGIIIAFVQPLRLGDRVRVEDETGQVEEIGLFYTVLKTWDNRRILIPNQLLSNRVVKNYTVRDPVMAAAVSLKVGLDTDVEATRGELLRIARAHRLFVDDPPPAVEVVDSDAAGMTVRLTAWAADQSDAWTLGTELREQALAALAVQGTPVSAQRFILVGSGGAGEG